MLYVFFTIIKEILLISHTGNRSQGSASNSTSLLVKRPDESLEDPPAAKREKKNDANGNFYKYYTSHYFI